MDRQIRRWRRQAYKRLSSKEAFKAYYSLACVLNVIMWIAVCVLYTKKKPWYWNWLRR